MRSKPEIQSELFLLRWRAGDRAGLEGLMQTWERRLFYYLRRTLSSEEDSWDVLQEVWLRVWQHAGEVKSPKCLPAWLYRIAHNTAVSHLRRQRRYQETLESAPAPPEEGAAAFTAEDAERIHAGLDRLPLPFREVLVLFFLEEFSQAEIAEILGIPAGTVKSRLFYAKQALRGELDKEAL
ncbi:MAG: RNA polymerase sigma factor [Candidatus Hydrogenedentes bacterium]|nr:RNA polymerase sigma factor [Candidatus Hydrogenedentota bacterium]